MSEPEESTGTASVTVQNPVRCRRSAVDRLSNWIPGVVIELVPQGATVTVRLVGDTEMKRLNRIFRSRDETTDVLSFPCGEELDGGTHLGDIAISAPVARRQARDRGHSFTRELMTLSLHGLLHCLGYDHEVDDGAMQRLEAELRERWLQDAD